MNNHMYKTSGMVFNNMDLTCPINWFVQFPLTKSHFGESHSWSICILGWFVHGQSLRVRVMYGTASLKSSHILLNKCVCNIYGIRILSFKINLFSYITILFHFLHFLIILNIIACALS